MILYTASYRAWAQSRPGAAVVASLTTPKWLPEAADWPKLWPVTPRWSYFHASRADYDRAFLGQLDRYGARRIAAELASITRATAADELYVLCWETANADATCHRRLWARWWLETVGETIPDLEAT